MKALWISLRLFRSRPFANLALALELMAAAIALVVVGNIYLYSTFSVSVLQNSASRILYCSNFDSRIMGGGSWPAGAADDFREKLRQTAGEFPEIRGFSNFTNGLLVFNQEKAEKHLPLEFYEGTEVLTMDDASIQNISLPLSQGSWLTPGLTPQGRIPCVMGGLYAGRHYVGEVIKAYSFNEDDSPPAELELEVTGILAQPVRMPKATLSTNNMELAANRLFTDDSNRILMTIIPEKYYKGIVTQEHTSAWLYVDRSCTPERLDAIRDSLTRQYTALDTDMIVQEKIQIGQTVQVMMPYIILLFLVVLTGLLAISMLTTIKNMNTFRVYYLVGGSKRSVMLIMLYYVLFFFVLAAILFALVFAWLGKNARLIHPVAALDAYFLLNPSTLLLILLVCAAVLVCSLVIPFVLLRKNDLSQLLRKE